MCWLLRTAGYMYVHIVRYEETRLTIRIPAGPELTWTPDRLQQIRDQARTLQICQSFVNRINKKKIHRSHHSLTRKLRNHGRATSTSFLSQNWKPGCRHSILSTNLGHDCKILTFINNKDGQQSEGTAYKIYFGLLHKNILSAFE